MSDYEFKLDPSERPGLARWTSELKDAIEASLEGAATVRRTAGTSDEDTFEQAVVIATSDGAELSVIVEWDKDAGKVELELSSASKASGPLGYLPMVLALVVGFFADKSPELLPVLRGIRVAVGLTVGLVLGFVVTGILGAALAKKKPTFDPALEAKVREAVERTVEAKAALAA